MYAVPHKDFSMASLTGNHMQNRHAMLRHPLLSGRVSRKYLPQLLIILLLLLTPLTFSNDNIPNFEPECEISSLVFTKGVTASAVLAPIPSIVHHAHAQSPAPSYLISAHFIPSATQISLATPSRAPPA